MKFIHASQKTKQKLTKPRWVYDKWNEETWKRMKRVKSRETMREFQGKLERSLLKRPVRPISVITRLSLSPSMIVRSKSNTTTVSPAIPSAGVGFSRYQIKRAGFSLSSLFDFLLWDLVGFFFFFWNLVVGCIGLIIVCCKLYEPSDLIDDFFFFFSLS